MNKSFVVTTNHILSEIKKEYNDVIVNEGHASKYSLFIKKDFDEFLDLIFTKILNRPIDINGYAYYHEKYNALKLDYKKKIIKELIHSQEFQDLELTEIERNHMLAELSFSNLDLKKREIIANKTMYSIPELIIGTDSQFIINLYAALLKREPDEEGFNNYFQKLKKGAKREKMILDVYLSEECQTKEIMISGIWLYRVYFNLIKIPLLNKIFSSNHFATVNKYLIRKFIAK